MSAYIVDDITINRIVSFIYYEKDCFLKPNLDKFLSKLKILNEEEGLKRFAKMIMALNVESVSQRYGKNKLSKEELNSVDTFVFDLDVPFNKRSIEQVYNSLRCLTYQCCEGNCYKKKVYKILEEIEKALAYHIANKQTEIKGCVWG